MGLPREVAREAPSHWELRKLRQAQWTLFQVAKGSANSGEEGNDMVRSGFQNIIWLHREKQMERVLIH